MGVITAEGLVKTYGSGKNQVLALNGLNLTVEEGEVLGLLGPNGAGKTTTVRILTTLLRPDSGRATVAGYDVVSQAQQIRSVIGLSGQYAAVDENLTGKENLVMFGRLYQLPGAEAKRRAMELLEQFDLTEAANRPIKTYSGGMRRRLDLASSIIGRPRLLFLDEPTTGLDPRSRVGMWDVIRDLVRGGTTLLLTTQYLEEADELANEIAVVDHGRIIAKGTSSELKASVGGERIEIVTRHHDDLARAVETLGRIGEPNHQVDVENRRITIPTNHGVRSLIRVGQALDEAHIDIDDIGLRRPTLDDVFITLTGQPADQVPGNDDSSGEPAAAMAGQNSRSNV